MRLVTVAAFAALPLCVPLLAAAQATPPKVAYLTSEQTAALKLPFSEAVRVGDVLYLSGQIGVAPGTLKLVPGGIEAEAKQALANIRAVLERNGSSMDRVFKCTVMLADIAEWQKFNAVYVTFFDTHFPARSALGASGLAMGARVEIECMATVAPGK
jgi:2-iminobutanoate/2-iminopropanoate deaminase